MNIFKIMNLSAWGLSAVIVTLLLFDFIKVEYSRKKDMEENND